LISPLSFYLQMYSMQNKAQRALPKESSLWSLKVPPHFYDDSWNYIRFLDCSIKLRYVCANFRIFYLLALCLIICYEELKISMPLHCHPKYNQKICQVLNAGELNQSEVISHINKMIEFYYWEFFCCLPLTWQFIEDINICSATFDQVICLL